MSLKLYPIMNRKLLGGSLSKRMGRLFFVTSSILTLGIFVWCMGRSSAPKNCLEVPGIVSAVEIDGVSFGECTPISRYFGPLPPAQIHFLEVFSRIDSLAPIRPYFVADQVKVRVNLGQPEPVVSNVQEIVLNLQDLEAEGRLERAILAARMRMGSELTAEVAGDFLWQILERSPRPVVSSWVNMLSKIVGYCKTGTPMLVHEEFCAEQNRLEDSFISDYDPTPVVWSLKPMLVDILLQLYAGQNRAGRDVMLRNLIFLGDLEELLFTGDQNFRPNLITTENRIMTALKSWLLPVIDQPQKVHAALGQFTLEKIAPVTYVYVARSARLVFPEEYYDFPNSRMVVDAGGSKYFPPSDVGYQVDHRELSEKLKIDRVLWVGCSIPSPESLQDLADLGPRVTFIRQCEEGDVDWAELAAIGADRYLLDHPEADFMEFDLAALALANRLRGRLEGQDTLASWMKWLLWQDEVVVDGTIKRPLAAIDGVRRYRMQNGEASL